MNRDKIIIRTSIIGIAANVLLASFKAVVGLLSSSIAIVLDAVNNLSDVMSSLITIIGAKLAGKLPDKEHPYGHGRIEYISTVLIAFLVLYAGFASFAESVKKIISPITPDHSALTLIVTGSAVVVKILLGMYFRRTGKAVNSSSLQASGTDALMDSIVSFSTFAAAIFFMVSGLNIEAWLGTVISAIIIKSGIDMLRESFSAIIGQSPESSFADEVRSTIEAFEGVQGAYDLVLHNYGPQTYIGSVHIEVPDTMTVSALDKLERKIADKVLAKHRVILAGISVYSMNTTNDRKSEIYSDIRRTVMSHEQVIQFHGFFLDDETQTINFDIIIDFTVEDVKAVHDVICSEIQEKYPDYAVKVTLDLN